MSTHYSRIFDLWRELKRRKVTRVITVYAASAFVILELVSIVVEPLRLPDWTLTLVIVLLFVGLVITFVLSWIYDVIPGGIEKTKPSHSKDPVAMPGSSKGWKIASYISFVVITGLIALNIFGGRRGVRIDESLAKSIAVLPFHNFSGDPGQDYICYGLTDEIISNLFKVASFDEVRSLTSVNPFEDSELSIREIAQELQVNYILEGSFKRIGDEMRVTAQLIEPASDNHIWLRDYDLPYEEVIGIPAEIALQIAEHLKVFLGASETEVIRSISTDDMEAYQALKQAEYLFKTEGSSAESQISELLQKAIRLDPEYATAYAAAGTFTLLKGTYAGQVEIQDAALDALPFFAKALELNQNDAMAHLGMAIFHEYAMWEYVEAEKEYLKAIELEPNNPLVVSVSSEFYVEMKELETLWIITDKAPKEANVLSRVIQGHVLSGNRKEAYSTIHSISGDEQAYRWIGEFYLWLGEFDSARFYLETALQAEHPDMTSPRFQAYTALAYARTGSPEHAQRIIEQLTARNDTTRVGSPAYFLGWYYSGIGMLDSAFLWLDRAVGNHSPELKWVKADPAFNSLKGDDRYWDLYERTGHKAYDEYVASLGR